MGKLHSITKETFRTQHSHDMWNWIVEQRNSHCIPHWHCSVFFGQQRAILKSSHCIQPSFGRTVNETSVDPRSHLVNLTNKKIKMKTPIQQSVQFWCHYLLSRCIRTLTGIPIVGRSMERNVLITATFFIVHLVAFFDFDAVHFNGTSRFGCHDDFVGDHLTEECQQSGSICLRCKTIFSTHEQSTESSWRWSIGSCQSIYAIGIGRWCFSNEVTICKRKMKFLMLFTRLLVFHAKFEIKK